VTDCPLNDKERTAIDLLARGKNTKMVAYEMGKSRQTIEAYITTAKRKTGSSSLVHTVAIAIKSGWIQ